MNNKDVNLSFYLTVSEREIAVPTRKEEYFLKDWAREHFKKDLVSFGIDEILEKTSILNLQKISQYQSKSRHIIICISGFLTEDVEKKESWRHLINHYKNAEIYALNWNSLTVSNFYNEGHYKDKKSKSRMIGKILFIKAGRKQFVYALEQTKVAGTLLALFLM